MILGDVGIDDLTPNGFNSAKRSTLILAHQSAVADHVCHQDRCKSALRVHLMHSRSPLSARQGRQLANTARGSMTAVNLAPLGHGGLGKV